MYLSNNFKSDKIKDYKKRTQRKENGIPKVSNAFAQYFHEEINEQFSRDSLWLKCMQPISVGAAEYYLRSYCSKYGR